MTDINSRAGLPQHLRVLTDLYPRADWERHNNFSDMTRFWLDRHIMFRTLVSRLQKDTQGYLDQPHARFAPNLHRLTGFFLNQLHHHHGVEDHHYFPMLIPYDDRLIAGFELLESDHEALGDHIHVLAEKTDMVLAAIKQESDARVQADELLHAQTEFEKFLHRHLEDEEELVVPIILQYGPPELG